MLGKTASTKSGSRRRNSASNSGGNSGDSNSGGGQGGFGYHESYDLDSNSTMASRAPTREDEDSQVASQLG